MVADRLLAVCTNNDGFCTKGDRFCTENDELYTKLRLLVFVARILPSAIVAMAGGLVPSVPEEDEPVAEVDTVGVYSDDLAAEVAEGGS